MAFKSSVLEILQSRGLIYQVSDGDGRLDSLLQNEMVVYHGVDPTSNVLHIGNLVPLMIMKWIQKRGHKVVILIGGATARIGDPSGRDAERNTMEHSEIKSNISAIKEFIRNFFKTENDFTLDVEIVDNYSWLYNLSILDFLGGIGKNASVSKMLSTDSVKNRLSRDSYLSFTEFSYSILQAYDFIHLCKQYNCKLQVGGADQWANIIAGVNLAKKMYSEILYGMTCPLILDANGKKIGKSSDNSSSVSIYYEDKASAYDYWQFWRNTHDSCVEQYLKVFTFLSLDTIKTSVSEDINKAKILLADEATSIVYGEQLVHEIRKTVSVLYGESNEQYHNLSLIKSIERSYTELQEGIPYAKLLVDLDLCNSITEAKKLIKGKGMKIDRIMVDDENGVLSLSSFTKGNVTLISVGNRVRFVKLSTQTKSSN